MQFIARAPIVPGLVFILLLCWAQDSFSQDIPLDEKLERASGLALVEISSLTDSIDTHQQTLEAAMLQVGKRGGSSNLRS